MMKYMVGQKVHIKNSKLFSKEHEYSCGIIDRIIDDYYIIYLDAWPKPVKQTISVEYVPIAFLEEELKYIPLCPICLENKLLGE